LSSQLEQSSFHASVGALEKLFSGLSNSTTFVHARKKEKRKKDSGPAAPTVACARREQDLGQSGCRGTRVVWNAMALCERSHITSISCNHMIVRNLRRPSKLIKCDGKDEGTGTRSDYLVNRGDGKNDGHFLQQLHDNREIAGEWAVGVWEYTDSWLKAPISPRNQIQNLTDFLCCHIYCVQLGTTWDAVVGAYRAVFNRESRYPPLHTKQKSWYRIRVLGTKLAYGQN